MSKKMKVFLGVAAVTLAVVMVFGGVALADDEGDGSQPGALFGALWEKVCSIYEQKTGVVLDQEALTDAFAEAKGEMRTETRRNCLQGLVEQGKITQEQADELEAWWDARPDVQMGVGFRGHCGGGLGRLRALAVIVRPGSDA